MARCQHDRGADLALNRPQALLSDARIGRSSLGKDEKCPKDGTANLAAGCDQCCIVALTAVRLVFSRDRASCPEGLCGVVLTRSL